MHETQPTRPVKYIVFTWVPDDKLDEWNEWQTNEHIPDVLGTGHIRAARKYRVADNSLPGTWQPQYATVYELDSMTDLDAYLAGPATLMRQKQAERYGAIGKIARMVLVEDE